MQRKCGVSWYSAVEICCTNLYKGPDDDCLLEGMLLAMDTIDVFEIDYHP